MEDVIELCVKLLKVEPEEIYEKAAIAARYVEEKHIQYQRMKFQLETAKHYRENKEILDIDFPFFLPEVNIEEEKKFAIRK